MMSRPDVANMASPNRPVRPRAAKPGNPAMRRPARYLAVILIVVFALDDTASPSRRALST